MMRLLNKLVWRYKEFWANVELLSFSSLLKYYFTYLLSNKLVCVKLKRNPRKFYVRINNSTDREVLKYVFLKKYHLPPIEFSLPERAVIVDLGANIGCTVVDLKMKYPKAKIFAYELHPANFLLAEKNCYQLQDIHLFNQAIWLKKGDVYFSSANRTDAFFVATTVLNQNAIKVKSLSIADVFYENNLKIIDFLKMDIEGAEKEIFNNGKLDWLNCTNSLNIEFHDVSTEELDGYIKLIEGFGFKSFRSPHHWSSILAYRPIEAVIPGALN